MIITGLRLTKGINKAVFQNIIGEPLENFIDAAALQELKKLKLLKETPQNLAASPQGFLVLNTIIEKLCL